MKNEYYTYVHLNPCTNEIFYVGKGTGNRAYNKSKRNSVWKKYVEDLEIDFKILILKENQTNEEAELFEQMLIYKIGSVIEGGTLLNRSGLEFDLNMLIRFGEENDETIRRAPSKYINKTDMEIIEDLLSFPNLEFGQKAEESFEQVYSEFRNNYGNIEAYDEDLSFELEDFYDSLGALIKDMKYSAMEYKEFCEEMRELSLEIKEFKKENQEAINDLIDETLKSIEGEIKGLTNKQ